MRILLIEDDKKLCEAVEYQLRQQGFTVDICYEGDDGLRWLCQQAHDLVLLDRMLPVMDGVAVVRKARAMGVTTPVLMLTALGTIEQKVEGLDAGADDYLPKPFAIEELLARVRAMGRRPHQWGSTQSFTWGDITLNSDESILKKGEKVCSLSKRETRLLEAFLKNPEQTLPRATLLSYVWGPDAEVEEGNLDNYIHFLRRRLKEVGSSLLLTTVRGVGYRLEGSV